VLAKECEEADRRDLARTECAPAGRACRLSEASSEGAKEAARSRARNGFAEARDLVRVRRQGVQLCRIGKENHDVWPLSDPLIVARSLFGIRIDVARARVARQHVSNPDLLRLERLLVHPSVTPSQPDLIEAHGFILTLGSFLGFRRKARKIIAALFENSAVPVLHGRSFGDKWGCSAQSVLDQCFPVRRSAA
jgi:hypothetical protein